MDALTNKQIPPQPDWAGMALPDTWPDQVSFGRPASIWRVLRHVLGRPKPLQLSPELPGLAQIPRYALQEFHGLPNGNYSNHITKGYLRGFELVMLHSTGRARVALAQELAGAQRVLDVGTGGGAMAALLQQQGAEVWGLEPSPYLLRHAARAHPGLNLVQGVMEDMPLPDAWFDGVAVHFVMHEVPPKYLQAGLMEIARVLRPGGKLVIAEPAPHQARLPLGQLLRRWGWRGLYFRGLIKLIYEPFLAAWHDFDLQGAAAAQGLVLLRVEDDMPIKRWYFQRSAR